MDWARYRTLGIDLLLVGTLVLFFSSGLALFSVCPNPGVCYTEVNWPTLSPAIGLLAAGSFLAFMSFWQRHKAQ